MSVSSEQHLDNWFIQIDGQVNIGSAAALKQLLLEWLTSQANLRLDLGGLEEIDLTVLQLLWAFGRDAVSEGRSVECQLSAAVMTAAIEAGFDQLAGVPVRSAPCPD